MPRRPPRRRSRSETAVWVPTSMHISPVFTSFRNFKVTSLVLSISHSHSSASFGATVSGPEMAPGFFVARSDAGFEVTLSKLK